MKKVYLIVQLIIVVLFVECFAKQSIAQSSSQISSGLKEALELGISEGVDLLSAEDGYLKDEAVKILLPDELQKIDKTLRKVGLSSLADKGLEVLNRAAEDAVSEAKPIFVSAVTGLSINDALSLLTSSNESAATEYLKTNTNDQLVEAFEPKVKASLDEVKADEVWSTIITQYNKMPFVSKQVTPDLTEYVTEKAIDGLFVKIAEKEQEVRSSTASRTTSLLQKVFSLQD